MRSPDAHVGEFFKVCGTIGSITLLETGYYGKAYDISLRYTDAEAGVTYTYNVTYFAPLSAENLLVGDKVDMWGVFAHYTADNQPCFNIHFASLLE